MTGAEAIFSGLAIGLAAGFAPGPLMTLVIVQSLRFGSTEGMKVALAPLITDGPIIVVAILMAGALSPDSLIFKIISVMGALYLLYIAYKTLMVAISEVPDGSDENIVEVNSIKEAVIVNATSPHPYLFWFTVGAPLIVNSWKISIWSPIVFTLTFFGSLVGVKVLLAYLAGSGRRFIGSSGYKIVMVSLSVALLFFAMNLILEID